MATEYDFDGSTAAKQIWRACVKTITLTVNEDSVVKNLTGYDLHLTVKKKRSDDDADAVLTDTATIAAPTTGVGVFTLTTTQTAISPGIYFYDVQWDDGANDVDTVIYGTFQILEDTRKAS